MDQYRKSGTSPCRYAGKQGFFLVQNPSGVNRVNTLFSGYKHRIQTGTVGEIQVIEFIYNFNGLVDRCDRMFIARLDQQSQPFLEKLRAGVYYG